MMRPGRLEAAYDSSLRDSEGENRRHHSQKMIPNPLDAAGRVDWPDFILPRRTGVVQNMPFLEFFL